MPIKLDTSVINNAINGKPSKAFDAKFFNKKLTGVGKKRGLLNEMADPVNIDVSQTTQTENVQCLKRKYANGRNIEITSMPLYLISPNSIDNFVQRNNTTYIQNRNLLVTAPAPDFNKAAHIATFASGSKIYLVMKVHSLVLEERTSRNGSTSKTLTPCYEMAFYTVNDPNANEFAYLNSHRLRAGAKINTIDIWWTCNPENSYTKFKDEVCREILNIDTVQYHDDNYADYISAYSLYEGVIERSEEWQSKAGEILDKYFENMKKMILPNPNVPTNTVMQTLNGTQNLSNIKKTLSYIESYSIPLDLYRNIYASIKKHFPPDIVPELCKQNLNLLLSDTLNNLEQNKAQLTHLTQPAKPVNVPSFYSQEQAKAISSTEPLILVQSGAGCGKSSVILGRIDYMIDCGVNPKDITVLSFTNAAADHITDKNPNVHSMTIARMIHNIYTENFANHELSSIDTIINSLDIYFPHNSFAYNFKNALTAIVKNDNNAFTKMNNFIEKHYDEVISTLDTIKQTSLELEIIICYQQIENFKEPASITSKYLIIDEVQDNSIFEFVYTLKYVDKHKESLFIVGRHNCPRYKPY